MALNEIELDAVGTNNHGLRSMKHHVWHTINIHQDWAFIVRNIFSK